MEVEIQLDDVALGMELHTLIARLNRWSNRNAHVRLPSTQARLLALIEAHQAAHISELARADNCSQPGMSTQVRRLESQNLARRDPDPADGRAVRISLTEHGRALLDETRRVRAGAVAPVIATLDVNRRAELRGALETLTHLLNTADDTPDAA